MTIKDCILDNLKQIAMKSDVSNKHSAALIKNNTIYKYAFNKFVKKEIINNSDGDGIYYLTMHAEINAIYSYYNKRNVKGISKVFYSNENGDIVWEYLNDMELIHICSDINNRYKSTSPNLNKITF